MCPTSADGKHSTYEGETNFVMDGKTYFYISNRRAAKLELENFKDQRYGARSLSTTSGT